MAWKGKWPPKIGSATPSVKWSPDYVDVTAHGDSTRTYIPVAPATLTWTPSTFSTTTTVSSFPASPGVVGYGRISFSSAATYEPEPVEPPRQKGNVASLLGW